MTIVSVRGGVGPSGRGQEPMRSDRYTPRAEHPAAATDVRARGVDRDAVAAGHGRAVEHPAPDRLRRVTSRSAAARPSRGPRSPAAGPTRHTTRRPTRNTRRTTRNTTGPSVAAVVDAHAGRRRGRRIVA